MASAEKLHEVVRGVPSFGTVGRYFEALPAGWTSYPACRVRASLLGSLHARGALDAVEALPHLFAPGLLVDHLVPTSEWLPEVVHVAVLLAIRDLRFGAGPRGDEDFQRWLAVLNCGLLDQAEQNRATGTTSAADYVPHLASLWTSFHGGTPAVVTTHSPNHATLTLTHPTPLFPALLIEARRRAFAHALAKQGAVQPIVSARTTFAGADAATVFDVTWT